MSDVWIVYLEVKGSGLPAAGKGAFVECYVVATSARTATRLARARATEDAYEVVEVSDCLLFDAAEWDDENDAGGEVRSLARKAASDGAVHYGPFRVWTSEEGA